MLFDLNEINNTNSYSETNTNGALSTPPNTRDRSITIFSGNNGKSIVDSPIQITQNGAIQTIDGDTRGIGAIDLQSTRSYEGSVAGGAYSAVLSGNDNEIHSDYGVITGGYYNYLLAGARYSVITGGNSNSAYKDYCFVGTGESCFANGRGAFVGTGYYSGVSADFASIISARESGIDSFGSLIAVENPSNNSSIISGLRNFIINSPSSAILTGSYNQISNSENSYIAGGYRNEVSNAKYASILGGRGVKLNLYGQLGYGTGGILSNSSQAHLSSTQTSQLIAKNQSVDSTTTELFLEIETTSRIIIPNYTTWHFSIKGVAKRIGSVLGGIVIDYPDERLFYQLDGLIDKLQDETTVVILGSVDKTLKAAIDLPWDINVLADTTNGALKLEVVGEADKTIHWMAHINLVELSG